MLTTLVSLLPDDRVLNPRSRHSTSICLWITHNACRRRCGLNHATRGSGNVSRELLDSMGRPEGRADPPIRSSLYLDLPRTGHYTCHFLRRYR